MNSPIPVNHPTYHLLPTGIEGFDLPASVSAAQLATDYTARLIPNYTGVAVPLESLRILWQ
jgi:hypothetical protein